MTTTHVPAATGTLLSAAGITKAFGAQTAVDHVDLEIPYGDEAGPGGSNGSLTVVSCR